MASFISGGSISRLETVGAFDAAAAAFVGEFWEALIAVKPVGERSVSESSGCTLHGGR